jgi:hypothetical protein
MLYLGSSALVKLYVNELFSTEMQQLAQAASDALSRDRLRSGGPRRVRKRRARSFRCDSLRRPTLTSDAGAAYLFGIGH